MQNIIAINTNVIGTENVNSVNAREVYEYLEIKTHFSTWMQRTIEKFNFEENVDFQLFKSEKSKSNNPTIEYIVTLDMAKELCMITDTPKGKYVRKYFIKCEKELREQQHPEIKDPMLASIVSMAYKLDAVEQNVNKLTEKVDNIEVNKTILPPANYESVNRLAKMVGLSNNVVKKIIQLTNPKTAQAMKQLPDGSVKPYTAFKIKPVAKFAKKLKRSATPVGKKNVMFQSPLVEFRFQLI